MSAIHFDQPSKGNVSSDAPALSVTNEGTGDGLNAKSAKGNGVSGSTSDDIQAGVYGSVIGEPYSAGVWGEWGQSPPDFNDEDPRWRAGVRASNWDTQGGANEATSALYAESTTAYAIYAESRYLDAIWGEAPNEGTGVVGTSNGGYGVRGSSQTNAGVWGESQNYDGVFGISHSARNAGVSGHNTAGGWSGWFEGNVFVGGTLTANVDIVLGADCAEEFDVVATGEIEPGTVMVLDESGALRPSQQAYDKKVAGVISGAGSYKPGIILDKKEPSEGRMPVALVGKVYCKADAQYTPIEVGDLLTTSFTPGHAMKAEEPLKAFGAVIGKALRPLREGQGLIPILIALQ